MADSYLLKAVDVANTAKSLGTLIADPSVRNAAAFGKNLGNVGLGHGTIGNISAAIKSGHWKGGVPPSSYTEPP